PWIITLQRVNELGLDKFATSDFYGGLRGFLDSFDLKSRKMGYEDVRVFAVGDGMEIQSRKAGSDGLFSILPQAEDAPGDNEVLNARFGDGLAGWDMATWQVGNPQRGVNLSADWSGSGNDVFWMHMPGTPASGSIIDVRSAVMVSAGGTVYEASVKAAQHRGTSQMYMEFYDANMNLLSAVFIGGSGLESGAWQGNLANFNTLSGTATAPAGTAYRRMVLRLVANGGEAPFGFFTQPTSRAAGTATSSWDTEGEVLNIEDLSQIGYAITTPGATTSGNDFIDQRLNTGGVVIDDNHDEYVSDGYNYYNGWDYEWVDTSYWTTVSGGDDIFVGGQGGDQLYGRSGWDWLDGRGGNDYIDGGDGNDTLLGRGGNDTLVGGSGDDYLAGDTGDDGLYGGTGDDVLVGGDGADTLQGEDGNDTFILTADYTWNWIVGGNFNFSSDPTGSDTVSAERFGFGVTLDLDVRPADWNSHPDASIANPASRLLEVRSADGSQWYSSSGLIGIENATGSEYGDRLFGSAGNNVLKGGAGDDQLYGRDGDDILEGGGGADLLVGGGYYDTASYEGSLAGVYVDLSTGEAFGGDAEGDILQEIENLRGSNAADLLKGNFFHNRIEGLAGDDWIVATNGEDTYIGGEGMDFVDYSEGFAGGTSTYQVWVEDGYWEYDQWDYTQYWVSTGGHYETTTTTVAALNINLGSGYAQVRGTDGTVSNHTLSGVEGVIGTAYADTIGGGNADETFVGGAGNDYLYGGGGADTYVLNRGDGSDTIVEDSGGWNVISFGEDVKFSDLWGGTAGGASGWLDLGIRGDAQVRVGANFYPTAGNNKIKSIDMGGASQLDIGSINFGVASDDNSTTLVGSKTNSDLIMAMNGDDIVWGAQSGQVESNGNVVIGGLGADQIHTSNGDDQFGYDRGEGLDVIWDTGGEDTLAFGASVAAEDVIYEVVGADLYIGARNLSDAGQTASQVADRVQIVGGGIKYVVMDGYSNTVLYESFNTVEYVLAGGTSIDLRKLDIAWTQSVTYNYDYAYPIALDLDGDGLDLSTVDSSSVVVRTAGGGISQIGWVGPSDGFLAVDRDGDGAINRLSELSFVQDKPGATSDLEGLRTWDTNGDGMLDKNDRDFSKILLFVDANQNGRSTAGELRTLEEAGIAAINLGGLATGQTRDQTTESFVQNTISFVWADGRTGGGYDVALARRVLGSEGLYAGAYQAEWGAADEDGELGQLTNDPKAAAKAARIKARKGLLDAIGAGYDEVKAAAGLDFSDHDRVDATIAARWTKMSASEQASWLTGQQPSGKVRMISTQQALANDLNAAAKARRDVVDQGYAQAARSVSLEGLGQAGGQGALAADPAGLGVSFGSAGLGLSLAASEPLDAGAAYGGSGAASSAWWRQEAGSELLGGGSLAARLAAMDAGPGGLGLAAAGALDASLAQDQALLRQAMAGFGGRAGGGAAVWTREGASRETPLAASAGLKAAQPLLTA
ncbi:MAG: calcium-binding protein, partial [Caulobacter sp.]